MTIVERPMNNKVSLIKQHEKMLDVLDEALNQINAQIQSNADKYLQTEGQKPNFVAFEVALHEQQAAVAAIADLVEMVQTKELEIAGAEDLTDLVAAAHREEQEDAEDFRRQAMKKYGGER